MLVLHGLKNHHGAFMAKLVNHSHAPTTATFEFKPLAAVSLSHSLIVWLYYDIDDCEDCSR